MRQAVFTLAAGAAGGYAFTLIGAPLPWMMGAMVTTTALSLGGFKLTVPAHLRSVMIMVLGVLLGSAFTPDVVTRMSEWPLTLTALAVHVVLTTGLLFAWFRWALGYDLVTAYFSAAPGGLAEMVNAGGEMGGNERSIALVHAGRILFVVLTVPLWFRFMHGAEVTGLSFNAHADAAATLGAIDALLLLACAVIGFPLAKLMRVPAAMLVGPMIVSALIHAVGITASSPPTPLVAVAQVIVGAAIGTRFSGTRFGEVSRTLAHTLGSTALMLAMALLAAWLLHTLVDASKAAVLLAFAPGGLTEMSLVALALNLETAFVATHHIMRIVIIVVAAPLLFRLLSARKKN